MKLFDLVLNFNILLVVFLHVFLLLVLHQGFIFQREAAFWIYQQIIGVISDGKRIMNNAGFNFGCFLHLNSIFNFAHILKAAQLWASIGYWNRFWLFSFPLFDLLLEMIFQPFLSPFIVQHKFMHVVAEISQQIFCFSEARFLSWGLSCPKKELLPFIVVCQNGTAIFRKILFAALDISVVTVGEFKFVHKRGVDGAFPNNRSIQECISSWIDKKLPVFEALTLMNSSDNLRFFEVMLLKSQEYLSKEIMEKWGDWLG